MNVVLITGGSSGIGASTAFKGALDQCAVD